MKIPARWGIVGLLCWFVPSVGVAVVLTGLGVAGISSANSHPFPGDPPFADLLVGVALCGWLFLLAGYCFFFVARKESDRIIQLWRWVLPPLTLLSFLAMSPALAEVAGRHWGEWGRLKAMLHDNEARVRAFSSRADGALSEEEVARAKALFLDQPVTFRFKTEPEPVRIRLMSPVPPYVGVDFGEGQNAVFDPVTMYCIYSD